jgi:hypothetical protein
MAGQVVVLKNAKSAEQIADEETKLKAAMLAWADDIAGKVIRAALRPPAAAQRPQHRNAAFQDDSQGSHRGDSQGNRSLRDRGR